MKKILYLVFLLTSLIWTSTGLLAQVPVAYYPFSGNAKDASAYANHATVNGALLTQDRFGWSNSAMALDGEHAFVQAANAAQLNSPKATIGFWVNATEWPATGEVFLISFGGWQERYKVSLPASGKIVWTTNSTGGISDLDSGDSNVLQPGVWTHVVVVHDGAKDKIYMNGAKVAEKDVVGDLNTTDKPLGIGYSPLDNDYFFHGLIDEVIILDVALSDFEIAAGYLLQSTPPAVPPGKVAAYSFDGNAADGSGYNNHAAMVDGKITTDRFGYGNSALVCNGTSTEVTAPNGSQLNSPYTSVSFWVKPNSLPPSGQVYLLSFGDWSERWKISLPDHGKPVWTTNSTSGISDMDSGGSNALQPGTWTHLVFVHDGAKDKIYMNGSMVAEKDVTGDLNSATAPLAFGYSPGNGLWFDGALDEVEIYNYALTDTEIGDLYTDQSTFPGVASTLVAGYSLNGNGLDESQFGNHAVLADDAAAEANRHDWGGNALSGSATADNSIALQTPYTTVSFWVKPNSLPPSGQVFLLSNGGWQERWKISLPDHGKPVWTTNGTGGISDMDSGGTNALQAGVWTHLAMVHDGLKDRIYMNGVQVAEKDVTGELNSTKYPLGIGYDPVDGGSFFDGVIDDVAIFNVALTAPEIAALYAFMAPEPTVPGDLVAYYPFSGNGWDVTDYQNHASGVSLTPDQFNRANNAAAFNGVNTEVTAANSPQLNTPLTTISFWVNPNSLPPSGQVYLLSHGDWSERWKISLPDHGKPVFTTNSTSGISDMDSGGTNALQVGVWTHVVMVHDGLKDRIYMDGVQVAEKDVTGDLNSTTQPLGIGYSPGNGLWFDGLIDEVQIYKTALSATEIADLYAAQSTPPTPSDTEAPDAPLNLTAEVVFNHVSLAWFPATDNVGVVAYNVYIDGGLAGTTANTTAYFPNLTPLTEFVFGVTALDAEGNESAMTTRNVTTGVDETPDTTPPTVPGNLQGNPSSNAVVLTWEASTDDTQVAAYVILIDGVVADTIGAANLNYFAGGLEPLTLYTFEVYAYDLAGNDSEKAEITLSTTEPVQTAEPGLVAHYPFDGNADDVTPYANHGVIGGDPTFENVTHPFGGQAIVFDGMQDSVLAANAPQLISDYATVTFWIRVDAVPVDNECYIMDFGHYDQRWKISLPQHLRIVWSTNRNNSQFPNLIHDMDSGEGNELVLGFWWYVTMVHDGTNDIIYVNGAVANSDPSDGKLNSTGRPLGFGNSPIATGKYYFTGALDNVKIYNKALTPQEVLNLFETGISGTDEPVNLLTGYIQNAFPNPATDVLTVNHSLPSNQPLYLRVFDLQGRQVDDLRLSAFEVANGQFTLNVGDYNPGMYSLHFELGGKNLGSLMFNKK